MELVNELGLQRAGTNLFKLQSALPAGQGLSDKGVFHSNILSRSPGLSLPALSIRLELYKPS